MSVQAITWAFAQPIKSKGAKLVLLALANYADDKGRCWPSQTTLASDTGYSRQGVAKVIKELESLGLVSHKRRKRDDGGQTSNLYELAVLHPPVNSVDTPLQRMSSTPLSTPVDTPLQLQSLHEPLLEPSIEPSEEETKGKVISDEMTLAISSYNDLADRVGLAKAQKLSEARKRKLQARLKDCGGIDGWRAALEKVEASAFLRGDNDRGWRANFDFLMQESSFTKVMEGVYADCGVQSGSGGRAGSNRRKSTSILAVRNRLLDSG